MRSATCPICKMESNVIELTLPSSIEKGKSYPFIYFSCCNYYKQDPFLSFKEIDNLYNKEYSVFNRRGVFTFFMHKVIRSRVKRFRRLIKNKDVLEIGSGTGEFLYFCKKYKPKSVLGVETSEYAANLAKEKYNVNIVCSTVEEFKTEKKFDAIFMFHVIEHVTDPENIIAKCKSILNTGGVLIMETPNCDSFERRFYREFWAEWSVPFHTFIFSPKALNNVTSEAGLRPQKIYFSRFSNTYSFLIPYLKKHRNIFLLPFLGLKFLFKTTFAHLSKQSGTITIQAVN